MRDAAFMASKKLCLPSPLCAALRRFALIGKSVALIPNQFSAKPK
jgi:hypothetical protein